MNQILKRFARTLLSERLTGTLDYYRHPECGASWGGPFNGQPNRAQIFQSIIASIRPVAIVETGTYLGTTTELMAETGLPVYTVEGQPRNYGFARARLRRNRNISVRLGDSRAALRSFFDGPLSSARCAPIFGYLDAHWNEDLPLAEEIDIIFSHCLAAVVMIDDFRVPDDPGYGYDDYGNGKALTPAYIDPAGKKYGLQAFYPSTPSSAEGGLRRGCVVLARGAVHSDALTSCRLLRTLEKNEDIKGNAGN